MRLFVAIDLPDPAKSRLAEAAAELARQSSKGRFVPHENFHLTLAFIGDTHSLEAAAMAMRRAAAACECPSGAMELVLCGIGTFKGKAGHTWWVGAKATPELGPLAAGLARELEAGGLQVDGKGFRPHVTLARSVVARPPVGLEFPDLAVQARGLTLFSSDLSGTHPRYAAQRFAPFSPQLA